jgi:hypothetical protein
MYKSKLTEGNTQSNTKPYKPSTPPCKPPDGERAMFSMEEVLKNTKADNCTIVLVLKNGAQEYYASIPQPTQSIEYIVKAVGDRLRKIL